ncbi:MAG: thioredoxin domain-containing protein [Bacteroidales bacterium]|nr:thioredoxin domain-containing protein [Bacteroidales bacterium]
MNRLKSASSPYLQQHADNPVHWQEWGREALQMANYQNKPLIISIGYAACHWCHVMEHESFSDDEVAAFMNENFVCIKVDREERPDIDHIYMDAAQLINGQGGWPLNAFAMPDGKPFFAGTYFNKSRWMEVLKQISNYYKTDYEKVADYANKLAAGVSSEPMDGKVTKQDQEFTTGEYDSLWNVWKSQIDFKYGGFNRAPKFPLPVAWEFLLQYHYLTGNQEALTAVLNTLDEMAKGGIYDQIGGGFARYSVDAYWKVPHFEKMLYDNAQLVSLYSHAFQITKKERYREIVEQTLAFVERELTSPENGFYSSLNADSECEEGRFYVWTLEELANALKEDDQNLIFEYYQISKNGNWEKGKNILLPVSTKEVIAGHHQMVLPTFTTLLDKADRKLFRFREKRIRPTTDDKVLTAWNALMLKAYVHSFQALGQQEYLEKALKNANFIHDNMLKADGGLYRNFMNGKASIDAFLDDYALLAEAYLQLYSVTFDISWLEASKKLADYCLEHFFNPQTTMFYYTSDMSEALIARKYELADNVIPSSNSVMAKVLLKLGHYYDDQNYRRTSTLMLNQVLDEVKRSGPWYANWAVLMGLQSYEPFEVAIMGKDAVAKSHEMQFNYLPTCLFMGGDKENLPLLTKKLVEDSTIIYVCRNHTCKLPVEKISAALEQINADKHQTK